MPKSSKVQKIISFSSSQIFVTDKQQRYNLTEHNGKTRILEKQKEKETGKRKKPDMAGLNHEKDDTPLSLSTATRQTLTFYNGSQKTEKS